MVTPADARRLEAFGAAAPLRSGATFAEYDTLFFKDPNRPSDPTEGLKAAQFATTHARTSVLRNAIFANTVPRESVLLQPCLYVWNKEAVVHELYNNTDAKPCTKKMPAYIKLAGGVEPPLRP
jgi:hypothetical protein